MIKNSIISLIVHILIGAIIVISFEYISSDGENPLITRDFKFKDVDKIFALFSFVCALVVYFITGFRLEKLKTKFQKLISISTPILWSVILSISMIFVFNIFNLFVNNQTISILMKVSGFYFFPFIRVFIPQGSLFVQAFVLLLIIPSIMIWLGMMTSLYIFKNKSKKIFSVLLIITVISILLFIRYIFIDKIEIYDTPQNIYNKKPIATIWDERKIKEIKNIIKNYKILKVSIIETATTSNYTLCIYKLGKKIENIDLWINDYSSGLICVSNYDYLKYGRISKNNTKALESIINNSLR